MHSSKSVVAIFIITALMTCYVNMMPAPEADQSLVFRKNIDVSYEKIVENIVPALQEQIDARLEQNCYGEGTHRGANGYGCGEYPIGKILNSTVKRIDEVSVDEEKDKVLVKFNNGEVKLKNDFHLDVFMDRGQKSNWRDASLLDTKNETSIAVQNGIMETLTLRNNPKGSALYSMACTLFPGVNISTQASNFNTGIEYRWHFLFFSGTERISTYTKIKDGKFSIDNAKLCAIFKTEVVDLKPKITVMDISYPEVNNLNVVNPLAYGTDVVLHTWGVKLLSWLLDFFGIMDLEKLIAQEIEKEMQKGFDSRINIAVNDIKNGKAFEKLFDESIQKKLTRDIVGSYKVVVAKQFDPTPIRYQQSAASICEDVLRLQIKNGGFSIKNSVIVDFCKDVYADVEVVPFANSSTYDANKCYDYPFSPVSYSAKGKNTWWKKGCALSSQIKIQVDLPRLNTLKCLDSIQTDADGNYNWEDIKKCISSIDSDLLNLPKSVIDAINSQKLIKLSDIQNLARQKGVDEKIISRLALLLN